MTVCETGDMQSTSLLLPDNVDDVAHCLWPISTNIQKTGISEGSTTNSGSEGEKHKDRPNKSSYEHARNIVVDRRMKVQLWSKTEGKSLSECSSSWELCESIAHSLLGMFCALDLE